VAITAIKRNSSKGAIHIANTSANQKMSTLNI